MTIGKICCDRITELCDERNISINKLCTICGITQSTLSNITSARSQNPTISTLKKICDGLEITLADFFDCGMFFGLDQEIL